MLALSDYSLGLILSFIKRDPYSSDYFRTSCSRINKHACSMGVDKIENAVLNLFCSYEIYPKEYSIQSSLCIKVPCPSDCHHCRTPTKRKLPHPVANGLYSTMMWNLPPREIPTPLETAERNYEDEVVIRNNQMVDQCRYSLWLRTACFEGEGKIRTFTTKNMTFTVAPPDEYFMKICEELLTKVRSIGVLKVAGWKIDGNIMQYLIDHPKFQNLREIKFVNCLMLMKKEKFRFFIKSKPIKKIHLNCRFKEFLIDEKSIMHIDDMFIDACKQRISPANYTDITDNLLRYWINNPPYKMSLVSSVANFTIKGLIEFMKASLHTNSSAQYNLGIVGATDEEFTMLMNNSRVTRGLIWNIERCCGNWTAMVLFNPQDTVVKVFVCVYDVSDMPPSSQSFIRQRYELQSIIEKEDKHLQYLIHLRISSDSRGRVYIHKDIRILFTQNRTLDALNLEIQNNIGVSGSRYKLVSDTQQPDRPRYSPKK